MINLIKALLGLKNNYKIQSFTYFIPSPPPRSSGYREKQFDKVFYEFINRGYRILNFSTQASNGEKHSGMWVILIVQATHAKAEALNLDELMNESLISKAQDSGKAAIDGLYYIDDRAQEND